MNVEEMPPEGRLTDEARARMRREVLASTEEPVRRRRPWLVPSAAAAAVATLVAGATVAGLALADRTDDATPAGQGGPASSGAAHWSMSWGPSEELPPDGACVDEVASRLPGAEAAGQVAYGAGTTYLFTQGEKSIVCDTWAVVDGGPPTLLGVQRLGQPVSKDQLLISQNYSTNPDDGAQFFAAGAPIPGVRSIQYSFPDGSPADGGHLVDATITDDMWVTQYLLPAAPQRVWSEPVKVAVLYEDGSEEYVYLSELDLCAQTNHGC